MSSPLRFHSNDARFDLLLRAALVALAASLFIGCGSASLMQSDFTSTPIAIDGDLGEWGTATQPFDNQPVRIGIRHNQKFVYISLHSIDETFLRQILLGGMTLWFNPNGDKKRDLGIKFPIGRANLGPIRIDPSEPPSTTEQGPRMLRELEIVGSDGKGTRYPVDGIPGVSVQAYLEFGSFSYELQIPRESTPALNVAINPGSDGLFGIGLETGPIEIGQLAGARGDTGGLTAGGGGRAGGGRGGGGRGRGGGGARSAGPQGLDPIQIWRQVSLLREME